MNRTDIINALANKIDAETYLEIGVEDGKNFKKVNIPNKIGVDPDIKSAATHHLPSDIFFANLDPDSWVKYDVIFIDGLHHAEQVKRDIDNSMRFLSDKGYIVVHDCLPENEKQQVVPRNGQREWTGDVWKAILQCPYYYEIVDTDWGVAIIDKQDIRNQDIRKWEVNKDTHWLWFDKWTAILRYTEKRIITPEQFKEKYL